MNRLAGYYLFVLPSTLLRGELVALHLPAYRRRQHFDRDAIAAYQQHKLARLLRYAGRHSPYYARRFREAGLSTAERPDMAAFSTLPFLTKSELARNVAEISPRRFAIAYSKTTGGSTGQAVTLRKNADALARERAATARAYEWAGVRLGDPQLRFWGVPLLAQDRLTSRIVDIAANRKRISAFGFDDERMEQCWRTIESFRPVFLYGYASMLEQLARFAMERSLRLPESVVCAIATSEVLSRAMRETMTAGLHVPVFNEYGCGEVGSIAHECERGMMHVMADNLLVEIVDAQGRPASSGEIVVTDLHNLATPLIRYRVGDYATMTAQACECGRALPVLEGIHGRAYDMIRTPSGKQFHPEAVMYVFEWLKNRGADIRQFQVVQDRIDHLRVSLVRDSRERDAELERAITDRMAETLGTGIAIDFDYVDGIAREASGKIRLIKSSL